MNRQERSDFRRSDKWHKFKAKCRLHTSVDYITREPLIRNWNLHHLDLRHQNYTDISDMKKFLPLNPKTHELIHELFKYYHKNPKSIDRIKEVLEKMEEYTYGI